METQKYSGSLLDEMRKIGDPPADEAITALFKNHKVDAVQHLLPEMVRNDAVVLEKLPAEIRTFWLESQQVAKSAAREVKKGEEFFAHHDPSIEIVATPLPPPEKQN